MSRAANETDANDRYVALLKIGIELAAERDELRLLEKFCAAARGIVGAKYAMVGAFAPGSHASRLFSASGVPDDRIDTVRRAIESSRGLRLVATSRRTICVRNPATGPAAFGLPDDCPRINSFVGTPLLVRGDVYGWLCAANADRDSGFDGGDVSALQVLANQLGVALENINLVAELREHAARLERTAAELRAAQANAERMADRYVALFDRSPHPKWAVERETLAILAVNDAALRHYGYTRDEFLALTLHDVHAPEDARAIPALYGAGERTSESPRYWRHRKKDGTEIDVEITVNGIPFHDADALVVLATDVTERVLAEREQARMIAVLDATPDLVCITDPSARMLFMNRAARRVLGVADAIDVKTLDGFDFLPESERPRFASSEYLAVLAREGVWSGETNYVGADGTVVPVSAVIMAHRASDGTVEYFSGIARDLRERKQLEEQLRQSQKMEAVGRLAGGVAHDFNNLLSVILSYSAFILRDLPEGDPLRDDVDEIRKAGERASSLTRQLLIFSRQQVLQPRVLDLHETLAGIDRMLRRIVGEDVRLVFRPEATRSIVRVDPGSIEQVIMNLVVNARDAMPTGGTLTVETSSVTLDADYARDHFDLAAGPYVTLAVSDTGIGMDPATQARIFEPFFTTKESGKGTGLGLSTVFGIVRQSGGAVRVRSAPGQGARFEIYLPAVDAPTESPRSGASVVDPMAGHETVLLVEDEEPVRVVARNILRRQGYEVLEARNAGEAILHCEKPDVRVDLLLTDVVMPQMSGPELARRLARERPRMRVLCMSGYSDDSAIRHGLRNDAFAYIQKPITPDALSRKVREVLDGQRVPNAYPQG